MHRIATYAATGAMIFSSVTPVFAGTTITITNSSNGRDSDNGATIDLTSATTVVQENHTMVCNDIEQEAETGENKVKDNIGGDIEVTTGSVDQSALVITEAGMNTAGLGDCDDCDLSIEVVNEKNGRDSDNIADVTVTDVDTLFQDNKTRVKNKIEQEAETGENEIKDNIDGDVDLKTGDVDQSVAVETAAGANFADMGGYGNGERSLSLVNSSNGRDSDNIIDVELADVTVAVQENKARVYTKIDQEGETGENEVKDNIGGVDVETGYVDQSALIGAYLGMNALAVEECCDTSAELTNEMNGRDSENLIGITLADVMDLFQDNVQMIGNKADQEGETGENKVADNLSDDMKTGDVDASVEVFTQAGSNVIGENAGFDWWYFDFDGVSYSLMLLLTEMLL